MGPRDGSVDFAVWYATFVWQYGTWCGGLQGEVPQWMQRYTAEILRFIEFERRVLPYKFLEPLPDGN